ncbi:MAG TPA: hypothetical protein V6D14_14350 [Coleofasciculaceae cyanobacterium]
MASNMRYFSLLMLLPFSALLPSLGASAADSQNVLSQSLSSQDFWSQAQRLVQDQLYLITQIQRAIAQPDLNEVEAVRGRLVLQSGEVERFLQSQYRIPSFLCGNSTSSPNVASGLSVPQRQVFCALYASTQQLKPVVSQLDLRLPMLAGLAAPTVRPSPYEPLLSSPLNFQNPVKPRFRAVSEIPVPEPPVIGLPMKTAIAEEPPFQPAIAPPQPTTVALSTARKQLLSALPAFPSDVKILDPAPNAEIIDRGTYGLLSTEPQQYANFLAQPNTGIARVLPAQSYRLDPNQLRNRLQPTVAERFPFAPLKQSTSGFTPRFAIQIEKDNFQIPMPELDYGFMVNLGEVSLENLGATLKNIRTLSQNQRELFLKYSPPQQLEALQVERRRLLTGKDEAAFPAVSLSVSTQAPIVLNNTYLLRLIQFQLPEVLLKRESISRAQRRYLDQILETPSSDVLIAFQPVHQHSDGSYIVIWRLLKQFPDPQITDLEDYVDLE